MLSPTGRTQVTPLERQFHEAMLDIYRVAKNDAGYDATIFLGMVSTRGGLKTAQYLINTPKPSDGYTALFMRSRLDLTVEAVVVEHAKWHELFTTDELAKARARLKQYEYKPRTLA
jgi:hypothetical protein